MRPHPTRDNDIQDANDELPTAATASDALTGGTGFVPERYGRGALPAVQTFHPARRPGSRQQICRMEAAMTAPTKPAAPKAMSMADKTSARKCTPR